MEYIAINNLQLNNYKLVTSIQNGATYGVLGTNHDDVIKLLKILAGINKAKGECLYQFKTLFDNKEYFKNRIYCDFSLKMVDTLDGKRIKEDLMNRYGISFDEKNFKKLINETNVRSEVVITNEYKFTDLGINLSSYGVLSSIDSHNIIIANPLKYINKQDKDLKKKIINSLCDKNKYNNVIIDATDIYDIVPYLDYLIVLGDFDKVCVIEPNSDKFIVCDDYLGINNKIFKKGNIVVAKAPNDKEQFKELKKVVGKYKEMDFISAYSYYMGEKI